MKKTKIAGLLILLLNIFIPIFLFLKNIFGNGIGICSFERNLNTYNFYFFLFGIIIGILILSLKNYKLRKLLIWIYIVSIFVYSIFYITMTNENVKKENECMQNRPPVRLPV